MEKYKPKTRYIYNFVVPGMIESKLFPIKAYTKKQAIYFFKKENGNLRYVNVIKEKKPK